MAYFAKIENNIVTNVVVADSLQWCVDNLGGEWVQTYYSTEGKNYAGIGYTYDHVKDNFTAPQPFASWKLDEKLVWVPPVPIPENIHGKFWSEKTQTFKPIEEVITERNNELTK